MLQKGCSLQRLVPPSPLSSKLRADLTVKDYYWIGLAFPGKIIFTQNQLFLKTLSRQ